MPAPFKSVALMARNSTPGIQETLSSLIDFLKEAKIKMHIEAETARENDVSDIPSIEAGEIHKHSDLVIVVGGDGSLLHAAQTLVEQQVPILGINRGRLGFLTDIHPTDLHCKVSDILKGNYWQEERFLLSAKVNHKHPFHDHALNDVVLTSAKPVHILEFDIYINDDFVCHQRADGLIASTPTGSTAYALSAGGPILHPSLDAISLLPMFPHTLSSRPIVIRGDCDIRLTLCDNNSSAGLISCDGRQQRELTPGEMVTITKKTKPLHLIHPMDYNYYETLRTKLKWENKS